MTHAKEIIAYIVAVVLAGVLAWFGWSSLYDRIYDAGALAEREKAARGAAAAIAKLRAARDADVRELTRIHQQVNEKVSRDHDQEIADLRAERDADIRAAERRGGLRIPASVCRGEAAGPAQADGASRRDEEAAGTVRLPQQVETDLWALAGDADEVSAQLRACQSWIVRQGFYGTPSEN